MTSQRTECESHDDVTLLCWCGYSRDGKKPIHISADLQWGKAKIQKEWKDVWTPFQKSVYVYFRELALDHTDDKMLAARFACDQVFRFTENRLKRALKTGKSLYVAEKKPEIKSLFE
jgi:hypothetical protein